MTELRALYLLTTFLTLFAMACEDDDGDLTTPPTTPAAGVDFINFPNGAIFPEGIDRSLEGNFYAGSSEDGRLYVAPAGSMSFSVYQPTGDTLPTALGVHIFGQRMLVAGGESRRVLVVNLPNNISQSLSAPTVDADSSLLNDMSIGGDGEAYITDSYAPFIYRIPARGDTMEIAFDLRGSAIEYVEGFNLNGIVTSLDDRYLITVKTNTGVLYRIDRGNGEVSPITLTGGPLLGGDGMALDGNTLYVALNQSNEVAVIELAADYASGNVSRRIQQNFRFPTALVALRSEMYVLNAQLNARQGEVAIALPFSAVRVGL